MAHIDTGILDNDKPEVVVCAAPIEAIPRSNDCYHDSGSNRHVFHSRESFEEYTHIQPVKVHGFSKGLTIAAIGAGSVRLRGSYDGSPTSFTLTNCLHVPAAHANLISQVRLNKFGVSAYFEDGKVMLYKDKVPCIDGQIHNDMYRLNVWPVGSGVMNDEVQMMMMTKTLTDKPDFYTA